LKQSKRQARDRGRQEKKTQARGAQDVGGARCPSCKTMVLPEARFCHACGARLVGVPGAAQWHTPTVVLYAIIGLAVLVAVAGVVMMSGGNAPVAPPPPAAAPPVASAPSGGAGQPVDLSQMSPREAADRLFNRVIMASEQGNTDEAQRFAPMAIEAYGLVDRLDADAHYHMGLIYSVMGDSDAVREQISIIKQFAPNHLLALILEHDLAEKEGDTAAATRAAEAFAKAYDTEIMAGRPEYDAHRNTIEKFHAANPGR